MIAAIDKGIEDMTKYSKGFWRPVDSLHGNLYDKVIYTLGKGDEKQSGTSKDFFNFYASYRKGVDASTISQVTRKLLDVWYEQECLKYEEKQLPKKYRDYRELVKEYRDGILLFTITETMVWRKAVEDTIGLKAYYEAHRDSFQAGERVTAMEFQTDNLDNLKKAKAMMEAGKSLSEIDRDINESSPLNFKYRQVNYEKGKTHTGDPDLFGKPVGFRTDIIPAGSVFRLYEVTAITPPGIKEFENARSEAITKYQNFLEAEWLKTLQTKYPVKTDEKVLKKLYK